MCESIDRMSIFTTVYVCIYSTYIYIYTLYLMIVQGNIKWYNEIHARP